MAKADGQIPRRKYKNTGFLVPLTLAQRRARFNQKHPDVAKRHAHKANYAKHIDREYGMSYADYQRLHALQQGRCAICRCLEADAGGRSGRLTVDHCHATGRVRGLLCDRCNRGLGFLREDPLIARSLVAYIESRCVPAKKKGPLAG